jgi:hypothetical protein
LLPFSLPISNIPNEADYSGLAEGTMTHATEDRNAQFRALMNVLHSVSHDIFNPFDITRAHFESAGVDIGADILIPKRNSTRTKQTQPIIVRIHGGFLVSTSIEMLSIHTN